MFTPAEREILAVAMRSLICDTQMAAKRYLRENDTFRSKRETDRLEKYHQVLERVLGEDL